MFDWHEPLPDHNDPPNTPPCEGYTDKYVGYLPMHCPACGRVRVEAWLRTPEDGSRPFVVQVRCEKCGMDSDWEPRKAL